MPSGGPGIKPGLAGPPPKKCGGEKLKCFQCGRPREEHGNGQFCKPVSEEAKAKAKEAGEKAKSLRNLAASKKGSDGLKILHEGSLGSVMDVMCLVDPVFGPVSDLHTYLSGPGV